MASRPTERRVYRLGTFEVDCYAGEVRKHGVRIKIQDQPLKLLSALLERPGELITREELHQRLWPDDTFVDFENGLNAAVTRLRQALGDSAQTPRFIESLPRRGYRFVAPVTPRAGNSQTERAPDVLQTPEPQIPNVNGSDADRTAASLAIKSSGTAVLPWIIAAISLIALAILSIHSRERPSENRLVRFALPPPESARFGEFDSIAASPDGRLLAFTATDTAGESQLWVRSERSRSSPPCRHRGRIVPVLVSR